MSLNGLDSSQIAEAHEACVEPGTWYDCRIPLLEGQEVSELAEGLINFLTCIGFCSSTRVAMKLSCWVLAAAACPRCAMPWQLMRRRALYMAS